jgi:hypothetical protein
MFDISLNETIYPSSYMIGVAEVGSGVREITLLALLREGGALKGIPRKEINEIKDLAIVWNYDDDNTGDINVLQIYNHDTGEVYWEDSDEYVSSNGSSRTWTDGDELILSSLLMYGDLESTIGDYYV